MAEPEHAGIGRPSRPAAERVSRDLRTGRGDILRRRRRVGALALSAMGSLGVVTAYQMGLLRHLPEPPLPIFDADGVDASGEAYFYLNGPDGALGLVSYAVTVLLAGMGARRRAEEQPWIPLALAAKVGLDAIGALYLTAEQASRHRRFCSWCLAARARPAWAWFRWWYPRPEPRPDTSSGAVHDGGAPGVWTAPHPSLHRPPISAHRLLSDGRSTALVRPDGEIDWWCAPDMDSTPLLWSLLDARGAAARWTHVEPAWWSDDPAPPVSRTVLRRGRARIECRDALVADGGGVALVRLVRSQGGAVELEHELAAGGFDGPWAEWASGTARLAGGVELSVAGGRSAPEGEVLRTRLEVVPDRWTALVVGVDTPLEADVDRLTQRLVALEADTGRRRARAKLPRHHPERAADALAVLEACTYRPTGAVVAAPTTSLPEAPGADRQFDYRYSWLRDASLAISVAALLGRRGSAEKYLAFLHRLAPDGNPPEHPVADVHGGSVPPEREVADIAGWGASRPVRMGNDAAGQVQHDALGLMLEGISVFLQTGGALDDDTWRLVRATADRAAGAEPGPTSGIWELRRPQMLVSADIGRWLALDRAVWIARGWRPAARRAHWKRARTEIRRRVLGAVLPDGGLPQVYGGSTPDASALMAVVFGMVRPGDPRAGRLVTATLAALEVGPFLYRYPPGGDDGFEGREGAFLPVSWWAIGALAAVGRLDEARRRADELSAALPRLLAEEVDPVSGEGLGNAPLVWSHVEAARAMYLLDAAALRDRFGPPGLWLWRIGRYLRLRRSGRADRWVQDEGEIMSERSASNGPRPSPRRTSGRRGTGR